MTTEFHSISAEVSNGLSIDALIRHYETDPDSPRRKLRYSTKCNYDSLCLRLSTEHGYEHLSEINARVLLGWHERWSAPDTPEGKPKHYMGHGLVQMLRILINFGATILENKECERLALVLHRMRFPMGKPRSTFLTADQATAIRKRARALGLVSIAWTQAFQFDGILRQKDGIGELIPLTEKGPSTYVYDGKKWCWGLRWDEIDNSLLLTHVTSKRQKAVEIDLTLCPMIREELEADFPGCMSDRSLLPLAGPMIICETMGRPWTAVGFRRMWRRIADECGVPKSIRNMDSRSGAISEATDAGADLEHVRHAATHGDISMTQRYSRNGREKTAGVMKKRAEFRNAAAS